jgi:hypothetical protein
MSDKTEIDLILDLFHGILWLIGLFIVFAVKATVFLVMFIWESIINLVDPPVK